MSAMSDKDYYKILGVSQDASSDEIRRAFQKKARTMHPDVNKAPDAEEQFKEISEAYAVLSDDAKRRRYDQMRSGNVFGAGEAPGTAWGGSYGGGSPFGGMGGSPFGGMGGMGGFGGFANQRRGASYNPRAGQDVVYNLELDPKVAAAGTKRGVTYQHYATCDHCHGVGSEVSDHAKTCPTCSGSGTIDIDMGALFGGLGFGAMRIQCPECEGTGKVVADPCPHCNGSGRVLTADEVVVEAPPKSHDGDTIRLKGKGNAGTNGAETGDFVARVGVAAERLAPESQMGFQLIGFALPFMVLGLFFNILPSIVFIVVAPLALGLFMVARGGLTKHNMTWWKNAGNQVVAGLSNGFMIALFVTLLMSCAQGAGRGVGLGGL